MHCQASLKRCGGGEPARLPLLLAALAAEVPSCVAQLLGGVYDFGADRSGERRGDWTPSEWLSVMLIVMTICLGLSLSVGLCYYVNKRRTRITGSVISGRSWESGSRKQYSRAPSDLVAHI